MIRGRRWTIFDGFQNSERILVNILPLDEQPRGPQMFRQTRAHEYGNMRTVTKRERRTWTSPGRPMRIALEQEALDAWWVGMELDSSRYSTVWCRGFVHHLRRSLIELAV